MFGITKSIVKAVEQAPAALLRGIKGTKLEHLGVFAIQIAQDMTPEERELVRKAAKKIIIEAAKSYVAKN